MKYMGGKYRMAKYIIPIMLNGRKPDQYWVEPFVGGGSIISKISGKRIGADINPWTISALISIRDHVRELPKNDKEFTKEDYEKLKENDDCPYKGYAGFSFSYGGKWMSGWAKKGVQKGGTEHDYVREAYTTALEQSKRIQGVKLVCCDYQDLQIPPKSIIYCDPPYAKTTKYIGIIDFDHDTFWKWCRKKAREGHIVFVSETNAPPYFKCIWEKKRKSSIQIKETKIIVERLFQYKNQTGNAQFFASSDFSSVKRRTNYEINSS